MKSAVVGLLFVGFLGVAWSDSRLIVYPDYPAAIERDDAYEVTVSQGALSRRLVVWNHCEKSILNGRTHGGDVNRRFCEFAFSGEPVRVDIRVSEDVRSYAVFPSRLKLKSEFKDGVVSVWLDRPENFGLRLNDYDKSILSVLADAPEADVPRKDAPGVLYVDGWMDAVRKDGVIEVAKDIREVYVAPGAVLNARLYVKSPGCRVYGRGIILDPLSNIFRFNQSDNREFGTFRICAPDVTVEDVKLLDARSFNWIFIADRTRMRNTKTFSSMMCSDGMSFWGGRDVVVDHCWIYSGDNGLVVSGTQPLLVKDTSVGTSCAAIFPQSSFKVPSVLENVSVFRSDEGVINNYYNGTGPVEKRKSKTINVRFRNFSAVDMVQCAWIFQGRNMGTLPKTLVFDNASFPELSGTSSYMGIGKKGVAIKLTNDKHSLPTDNYHLFFTNLFVAGAAVSPEGLPASRIQNARTNEIVFAQRAFNGEVPLLPDRHEVGWTCPAERRRMPRAAMQANLVAETRPAHSVWQRCASYLTRLEARREADGSPVYVLTRTRPGNGMQANLTDEILAAGPGTYCLTCEARAVPAEGKSLPVPLAVSLLSNEHAQTKQTTIGADWTPVSLKLVSDFKMPPTGLVSLFVKFPQGVSTGEVRRISFVRE